MRYSWAVLLISAATLPVFLGMSSICAAQSSDSVPRSSDDGPPPGGCTPIGVTVSGEIVFPMTCKDFIERHKAADRAATAAETKPATAEASKAPEVIEAAKAPAASEVSKAPTAVETGTALTTGEASRAAATAELSVAPAAVEASKATSAPDSAKSSDENDAKPAPINAQADDPVRPETKQAAAAPEGADLAKPSADPATTAAVEKRSRARNRLAGGPDCTRYRTYNAANRTYRDFGGNRRSCP
jgi:hypothetical protein